MSSMILEVLFSVIKVFLNILQQCPGITYAEASWDCVRLISVIPDSTFTVPWGLSLLSLCLLSLPTVGNDRLGTFFLGISTSPTAPIRRASPPSWLSYQEVDLRFSLPFLLLFSSCSLPLTLTKREPCYHPWFSKILCISPDCFCLCLSSISTHISTSAKPN